MEIGWKKPTIIIKNGKKLKPKEDWSEADHNASKFNANTLSVIFVAIEGKPFQLIQESTLAKKV